MAWIPLQESGIAFELNGGETLMTNSVITPLSPTTGSWILSGIIAPANIRVIVLSYTATTGSLFSNQAAFTWGLSGSQVNTTLDGSAFTPAQMLTPITQTDIDGAAALIQYQRASADEGNMEESYAFLIEVEQPDPEAISYNCECDDPNPSRSLAELRTELMRRLGFSAMTASPPPGMNELLTSFLQGAQRSLYRTYRVLRTERFFTWQLLQGVKFYDLAENEDECVRELDPRMITWVGISDNDDWWRPLICGIPPECYAWARVQGWPQRYEIRQCIEVWPAPDNTANMKLRIKGHFGLDAFSADGDKCTIDDEAVFLFALARAKAHYGQPDARNYQEDAMAYITNLTAGAHQTRRYIPGELPILTPVPPIWIPKVYL